MSGKPVTHPDAYLGTIDETMETLDCGCRLWRVGNDDVAFRYCAKHAAASDMLAMLRAVNHALYVVGTGKAVREAMIGSKVLIDKVTNK